MMPDMLTLLEYYYGLQWSLPFVALSIGLGLFIIFYMGEYVGSVRTLKYVWERGVPHSQKQHQQLYLKWKNKIND